MSDLAKGFNFVKGAIYRGVNSGDILKKTYSYGGTLGAIGASAGLIAESPVLPVLGAIYGVKTIYDTAKALF